MAAPASLEPTWRRTRSFFSLCPSVLVHETHSIRLLAIWRGIPTGQTDELICNPLTCNPLIHVTLSIIIFFSNRNGVQTISH
mmetsp:Transcript_9794/g.28017  ORF Transcript_9794/g.28017 Transcript_9794/m.28017 type:complete len:82 (-) Transcript_9794:17-262(-)